SRSQNFILPIQFCFYYQLPTWMTDDKPVSFTPVPRRDALMDCRTWYPRSRGDAKCRRQWYGSMWLTCGYSPNHDISRRRVELFSREKRMIGRRRNKADFWYGRRDLVR